MEDHGYDLKVKDVNNLSPVKIENHVPMMLQSCHTAIVDGYVIEGHVPIAEVERLLAERPSIHGIGVAGMPVGSPGMEVAGTPAQPYDVIAFDKSGNMEVFASYPKP